MADARNTRFNRPLRALLMLSAVFAVALPMPAKAQQAGKTGAFDCLIQPKMVLKLGTPVPGLISELLVDRGSVVKKGDVIARLESAVEAAAVALAKARAENDSSARSGRTKVAFQLRKEDRTKQ